jgi:hypothetical protein
LIGVPYKTRYIFRFFLPSFVLLFCIKISVNAQDIPPPPPPTHAMNPARDPMRERAVVLHMVTRVLEKGDKEAWNSDTYKVTIPGRPIGLKIVGENIVVSVQFTPYPRRNGRGLLVAQGQIFTETPDGGVQCRTILHTVPLEYGEQVFFFPLGSGKSDDEAHIEIQIEMNRFDSVPVTEAPPQSAQ